MDHPEAVTVQDRHRAALSARYHALWAACAETRQDSRAAIATSKVRVARSRMEMERLRETRSQARGRIRSGAGGDARSMIF
jgi:hypothetical protein